VPAKIEGDAVSVCDAMADRDDDIAVVSDAVSPPVVDCDCVGVLCGGYDFVDNSNVTPVDAVVDTTTAGTVDVADGAVDGGSANTVGGAAVVGGAVVSVIGGNGGGPNATGAINDAIADAVAGVFVGGVFVGGVDGFAAAVGG
jgi:hypothetical protein